MVNGNESGICLGRGERETQNTSHRAMVKYSTPLTRQPSAWLMKNLQSLKRIGVNTGITTTLADETL